MRETSRGFDLGTPTRTNSSSILGNQSPVEQDPVGDPVECLHVTPRPTIGMAGCGCVPGCLQLRSKYVLDILCSTVEIGKDCVLCGVECLVRPFSKADSFT